MRSVAGRRRYPLLLGAVCALGAPLVVVPPAASAATTVAVDGSRMFQTMDGFGVSAAFGAASLVQNLGDTPARRQALDLLFSPTAGAGFSILRNLIPSDAAHTIEPNRPASPSATPAYVWNASSQTVDWSQLWFTRQARSYGVSTIYADAWSAPGFMKTNNNEASGGNLCGTPGASCASGDWRQAYANYLTQYLRFYQAAGINLSYLGFTNEPSFTATYSSMLINPSQAVDFARILGPTVRAAGLSTRITCCDTIGWSLLPGYTSAVLGDSAANSAVSLFTSHGYASAPSSAVNTGGKPVWESEWSHGQGTWNPNWDDGSAQSGFSWAQNIHNGLTAANLNAFLYWWGIWNNPNSNSALIRLDGSTLNPAKRYYSFVNYSRFIRPGAVRLAASSPDGNLRVSSFRNTDGSVIVVALNAATAAQATTFTLANTGLSTATATPFLTNGASNTAAQPAVPVSGGRFTATVPARSLVTYRVTGTATPPPPPGSGCQVSYQTNPWNTGLTADITITNTSTSTVSNWSLAFTLPAGQAITSSWNASYAPTSGQVTATNASHNATIPPGGSTGIGFQATHTGNTGPPAAFTLNGTACTVA
jgi:glucuronoarabinoxylan endo-1,4-beta-xylanase